VAVARFPVAGCWHRRRAVLSAMFHGHGHCHGHGPTDHGPRHTGRERFGWERSLRTVGRHSNGAREPSAVNRDRDRRRDRPRVRRPCPVPRVPSTVTVLRSLGTGGRGCNAPPRRGLLAPPPGRGERGVPRSRTHGSRSTAHGPRALRPRSEPMNGQPSQQQWPSAVSAPPSCALRQGGRCYCSSSSASAGCHAPSSRTWWSAARE
jgi:hypothetical protein